MHSRQKMKVLGLIFAVFIVVACGIILSLPSILSTKWGREQAVKLINSQIPGHISVESVSLSWIGSQVFKGLRLKSLEGDTILAFESFRTETPLIKFLFSGPSLGKSELKNLNLHIVEEYPEVTNLQQALGLKKIKFNRKKNEVIIRLPLADIVFKSKKPRNFHKPEPINFQNVDLLVDSTTFEKPILIKAKGSTHQGDLAGNFDIEAKFLSGMAQKWQFNRKAAVKIKAEIENFPVDMLDIALTLDQPDLHGVMRDMMGDRITIAIDQSLSETDGSFLIKTDSPTLNMNLIASLEEGKYILRQDGTMSFIITPELFDRIASRGRTTALVRLASPTQTRLTIDRLSLPIDFEDLYPNALNFGALSMHAKLDFQDANFVDSPLWGDISLREITSTIETTDTNAIWRLRGEADQNGRNIPIKLEATIHKPQFGENFFDSLRNQTHLQIHLAGVPIVSLDHAFKTKPLISSLFGPLGSLSLNYDGQSLKGTLTSHHKMAAIPSLSFEGKFTDQTTRFDLAANKGGFTGFYHQDENFIKGEVVGENLTLIEPSRGTICTFKRLQMQLVSLDGGKSIDYNIQAATHHNGHLDFAATAGPDLSFKLRMKDAPLAQLLTFFVPEWKVHNKVNTIFGEKVSVSTEGKVKDLEGKVNLVVEGPAGKIDADCTLKNGSLYLNKPFIGEFLVTPLLGKKVLADYVPLFRSMLSAEEPLCVTIDSENFSCPIAPFSWEKVNIAKGKVILGKTRFHKDKEIRGLLDLLETESDDSVQLWFTPTYFSVDNGVVHVNRFDMLFMKNYPLAAWGKVDLVKNKVKMTLGLTQETLKNAFKLENLDAEYVMQLPLEGNLDNASINKSKAALSISKLVDDPMLDTVLTFTGVDKGQKTPLPTTTPFPWSR